MWTKTYTFTIFAVLCVIVNYNVIHAKRILMITNWPSYSHQITYRGLCLELLKRGHEIVWVTPNPMKNSSLTNLTEIDLSYFYKGFPEYKTITTYNSFTAASLNLKFLESEEQLVWPASHVVNRATFKNPDFQKLYAADSNEHFDVVIVGQAVAYSLNAFAYRFNAPLIGISSLDVYNHLRYTLGSLILPSHMSNWQSNIATDSDMSFWDRVINFYDVWKQMYYWVNKHVPIEDALVKEYLGQDMPYIEDIIRNMSICFVSRYRMFSYGRTEQPNIIFLYGFHIEKQPPALSEDLEQFVNDTNGFIYVSLGTNVIWEDLPNGTFESFVEAFSALPYKVVWKCDPNLLPRKFQNILASKWLPQQSLLAHPNIKLFIYQGGMQSTEETMHFGVPIVGFPIIWDQIYNVRAVVKLGFGIRLHVNNVSKESIQDAIHEVVSNKRYKDRMEYMSKLYKDTPYNLFENAVQWIEYVMRHNGAPFLRNILSDKPWYQRYDWDIIGFFAIVIFIVSLISVWILLLILRFHLRILSNSLR